MSVVTTVDNTSTTMNNNNVDDSGLEVPLFIGEELRKEEQTIIDKLIDQTLPLQQPSSLTNFSFLKELYKEVLPQTYRKELSKSGRLTILRRIIFACAVRQVIINEKRPLPHINEIRQMPFFGDADYIPTSEDEVVYLRHYLRAVRTLHDIGMPGTNNKQAYVEIAAMLDGSNRTYAFGGAPSKATIRRSVIFHVVTGVPMRDAPRNRKRPRISDKDTKPIRSEAKRGHSRLLDCFDCMFEDMFTFDNKNDVDGILVS